MKNFFLNILTSLITLIILFFLLEIGLRAVVDKERYKPIVGETTWAMDDEIGWTNIPNMYLEWKDETGPLEFKTNSDGLQPNALIREKKEDVLRVMLIGNSTVAAMGVQPEGKLHILLDSLLDAAIGKVEVINAGVNGYSTDQSLYFLQRNIGLYRPDIVAYGYCMNDLFANSSPVSYGYNKPHVELTGDTLKYVGLMETNKKREQNEGSSSFSSALQNSVLYGMLRPYIRGVRLRFQEQNKIDQGGGFGVYEKNEIGAELKMLALLVQDMDEVCSANNAGFFFYGHPEVGTVWQPYREEVGLKNVDPYIVENKMKEVAEMAKVPFVGMVGYFEKNMDRGPFHLLPSDPHCNKMGYLLQAEVLSEYILKKFESDKDTVILN